MGPAPPGRDAGRPRGAFHRLTGRAAGALFLGAGLLVAADAVPAVLDGVRQARGNLVVGAVAMLAGLIYWRLPWHRWPRWAQAMPILPALGLIGLNNRFSQDPYLAGVFFFLLSMWIGSALPRGTTVALSPLILLDYWAPLVVVPHPPRLLHAACYIAAACAVAGETIAWLTARLHAAQTRLHATALAEQAYSDQLTGLPNRASLYDQARQALRAAGAADHRAAMLLIDLDRFKDVNDTLGHDHGDRLLQQVAARLGAALPAGGTVARLGGDEFGVLLPDIERVEQAEAVAGTLLEAIDAPFRLGELSLDIDASIGLAVYPDHAADPAELLQRADVAMYVAKAAHLGCVVYDPALDQHSARRLGLLGQLRRAIAAGEMTVFFQPKADARTGRVDGVEALVRWQHLEYGLLPPDEFIPLAETTGLTRPLTSYVLDVALRRCRELLDAGHHLSVAVNVSARCLLDPTLPDEIRGLLDRYHLPPNQLILEITETAMTDSTHSMKVLNRLRELGVLLSIDDFGTGYSSMAYLKDLPVDELKVDRSFITRLLDRPNDRTIVRSTVDLAHDLGLRVVAEGVEDAATWQELAELGCDLIQGYYLGRPMPGADLDGWLAAYRADAHGIPVLGTAIT